MTSYRVKDVVDRDGVVIGEITMTESGVLQLSTLVIHAKSTVPDECEGDFQNPLYSTTICNQCSQQLLEHYFYKSLVAPDM